MINLKYEVQAGIFLIACLVLFGISIWSLGRERQLFARQAEFTAAFTNVQGLSEGAPIRLGGIKIGRVDRVSFAPDRHDSKVYVTLLVNDRYLDRLRSDSKAAIQTQGLLGDRFVSISVGTSEEILPPNSLIEANEPKELLEVINSAGDAVSGASEIADSVKKMAQSIEKITREIETGDGALHALIYDKKGGELIGSLDGAVKKFSKAADSFNSISEEVVNGKGMLHSLIYADPSSTDMDGIIQRLNDTVANLEDASNALRSGTGTLGALIYDPALYDNLTEVTDNAKRSFILRQAIRSSLTQ